MSFLYFCDVSNIDIYKQVYSILDKNKRMIDDITIVNKLGIDNISLINQIPSDIFYIKYRDFLYENDTTIDTYFNAIFNLNANIVVDKKDVDEDFIYKIDNYIKKYNIIYYDIDSNFLNKEIVLKDIDNNAFNIILDFFKEDVSKYKYVKEDFIYNYIVDNNYDFCIKKNNKCICKMNIKKDKTLISEKMKSINDIIEKHKRGRTNYLFDSYIYEPYAFMKKDNHINLKIKEFKLKIFNLIKNIDPYDYKYLPEELSFLLCKTNYIQMKDIEDILINDF